MKNNNKRITDHLYKNQKMISLGKRSSMAYESDPIRFVFTLSRYKFVAKMFEGYKNVLEVGAGDGFKSPIVKQFTKKLTLSDIEKKNVSDFYKNRFNNTEYVVHDFTKEKYDKKYDGIYSLDVLEHINKKKEDIFLKNICSSLKKNGTLIVGMPSLESQKYASKWSKVGHINCKSKQNLKKLLEKYFNNVFMFSMNDELVHTGYDSMSHYLIGISCNKK